MFQTMTIFFVLFLDVSLLGADPGRLDPTPSLFLSPCSWANDEPSQPEPVCKSGRRRPVSCQRLLCNHGRPVGM